MRAAIVLAAIAVAPLKVWAQAPQPRLISPGVRPDRTVTFRLAAPSARSLRVARRLRAPRDEAGQRARTYPAPYLLHGFSDDASAWTAVGRAHVILDNLIAQGRARPMLVAMPLGYGTMELVSPATAGMRDAAMRRRSVDRFRAALIAEVIPFVEKRYGAAAQPSARAIAGLSMGGAESLFVGLNALDRFAWIGAFSSGGLDQDLNAVFPTLDRDANARLRLLWIACGTADRLVDSNRAIRQWLTEQEIRHTSNETSGGHTWMVWRRNLAAFVPLLFTGS